MLKSVELVYGRSQYHVKKVLVNGKPAQEIREDKDSPTGVSGCSRRVYVAGEYIVKVGSIGEALLEIDETDRKYFAEVVYVGLNQRWLVQRRVNCLPKAQTKRAQWNIVHRLIQKYNIGDVCWDRIEDESPRTPHNWTVNLEQRPVIFDYDFHPETGSAYDSWQAES